MYSLVALVAALGLVSAVPNPAPLLKRGFDAGQCSNPVAGLTEADCKHMSSIGFASQGKNANAPNGAAWLGNQGPNVFTFTNNANAPVTLVLWQDLPGDYTSMCVNVKQAAITASIANGASTVVSVANGVSGAWAGLYNEVSNLAQFGGVNNVWGEFTTGPYATVDVSREPNMNGNHMSIKVRNNGCVSEWTAQGGKCFFQCDGNAPSCTTGYSLQNCAPNSQPGATSGLWGNAASGGCQGFPNGGNVDVTFLD